MIAFSGLDGAGKSTQIDLMTNFYSRNKKKVLFFGVEEVILQECYMLKAFLLRKKLMLQVAIGQRLFLETNSFQTLLLEKHGCFYLF